MTSLVTIAIPVYKRFDYLPAALESVAAQDYPHLDVLISDNGLNGPELRELIERHHPKPYRLRRNDEIVSMTEHFNQLIDEAQGEYFILLCDDDYISPNYVSEMVRSIDGRPEVALGLSRVAVIDEGDTQVLGTTADAMPPLISSDEFFAAWSEGRYRFNNHVTNIVRTAEARQVGGYAHTIRGMCAEDALLVKISVGRSIALNTNCTFYHRSYSASMGQSLDYKQLAQAKREFCAVIDTHPAVLEYARRQPQRWARSREALNRVMWESYVTRWDRVYRQNLPFREAVHAIMLIPLNANHYGRLARIFRNMLLTTMLNGLKERLPLAHQIYRVLRYRHRAA
jgi:glycosyltransferase involved in cell wall biosynthesis